jgi:DNA-binding transcriptional LysR family regulator
VLRERVGTVVEEAAAILRPEAGLDLAGVVRTFTLRTSEGFVENVGPALLERVAREASGVRLRFVTKSGKDSAPLRDGSVDFETGVIGQATSPEIRAQALFRDRLIGAVRPGHPLSQGELTPARYAAGRHILVSRRGSEEGPVDTVLAALGLRREIAAIVSGFGAALALARSSDLIATVAEHHTGNLRAGLHSFTLPVPTGGFTVSLLWHPRLDGDAAHRWLRGCIRDVCADWR